MKKTLVALALAFLGSGASAQNAAPAAASLPSDLSLRGEFAWNGRNVFRGKERSKTDGLVQTALTLEYNLPGFSGVSLYGNFYDADSFERSYTFGGRLESAATTYDLGFQRLTATSAHTLGAHGFSQLLDESELFAGVSLNSVSFKPSAYLYYSNDQRQYTFEVAGGKSFAGSTLGLGGCDLETRAYAGYANARQVDGLLGVHNGYGYFGASVDLTHSFARGAKIGVGLNYTYNNDRLPATKSNTGWVRVFADLRF